MSAIFIWVVIALLAMTVVGKLVWLSKGGFPPRTPTAEACDVFLNIVLIVFGAVALAKG